MFLYELRINYEYTNLYDTDNYLIFMINFANESISIFV